MWFIWLHTFVKFVQNLSLNIVIERRKMIFFLFIEVTYRNVKVIFNIRMSFDIGHQFQNDYISMSSTKEEKEEVI